MAEDSSTADKSHLGQEPECRQVVEAISDWIWACDSQWRITFSNKAVEQILGHSPQQAIGRNVLELLHPDDRDQARKAIEQALRDRCGWRHVHLRWLHKGTSQALPEGTAISPSRSRPSNSFARTRSASRPS